MFLHLLLIYLQFMVLCHSRSNSGFSCGQVKCDPGKREVCVVTMDENDEKMEQFCQAGRFWNACSELGCKHNHCRTFIITTFDGRKKTPIVDCEISNKFPRERMFKPKPPYDLHPPSFELWSVLGLFICIIPFLVFGGFIGVSVCGMHFNTIGESQDTTDEMEELEEIKVADEDDDDKIDESLLQ